MGIRPSNSGNYRCPADIHGHCVHSFNPFACHGNPTEGGNFGVRLTPPYAAMPAYCYKRGCAPNCLDLTDVPDKKYVDDYIHQLIAAGINFDPWAPDAEAQLRGFPDARMYHGMPADPSYIPCRLLPQPEAPVVFPS